MILSQSEVPCWLFATCNLDAIQSQAFVGTGADYQEFKDEYIAFMKALTTRYNGSHAHVQVKNWTIWNEPNNRRFWQHNRPGTAASTDLAVGPKAQAYAGLYRDAVAQLSPTYIPLNSKIAFGPLTAGRDRDDDKGDHTHWNTLTQFRSRHSESQVRPSRVSTRLP